MFMHFHKQQRQLLIAYIYLYIYGLNTRSIQVPRQINIDELYSLSIKSKLSISNTKSTGVLTHHDSNWSFC